MFSRISPQIAASLEPLVASLLRFYRTIALSFFQNIFNGRIYELFEKYIHIEQMFQQYFIKRGCDKTIPLTR